MAHDFSKPPLGRTAEGSNHRRRIPVFILIIVGIFLASMIFYMIADRDPQPGQIPADTSIPATSQKDSAQSATATAVDDTVQSQSNTASSSSH